MPFLLFSRVRRAVAQSRSLPWSCVALLSATVLCLSPAVPVFHARSAATWGALLICVALLSAEQIRRFYERKLRMMRAHPSRYATEFLTLAENSRDAVFLLEAERDESGCVLDFAIRYVNGKALTLLTSAKSPVGARVTDVLPLLVTSGFADKFRRIADRDGTQTSEFAVDDEQVRAKWLRLSAARFEDGVLLTATDLTAEKQLHTALCHKAHYDTLTGLPNRLLLDDRLQQAFERAGRHRTAAAVMMLDIGNLRQLNEGHGHNAGDHVLRTAARRLREAVRATDSVFRLGSGQFVVLLTDVPEQVNVVDFARKVSGSLSAPILWNGQRLEVFLSAGTAVYPEAGTTPETLMVQANIDMHRTKRLQTERPAVLAGGTPAFAEISNFAYGFR